MTIVTRRTPELLARARPPLSSSRQSEGRIRSFGLDAGPSAFAPPQPPGYAQLVTIRSGVARLSFRGERYGSGTRERIFFAKRVHYGVSSRVRHHTGPRFAALGRAIGETTFERRMHA